MSEHGQDRPATADYKIITSNGGFHLFASDGSCLYGIPNSLADRLSEAIAGNSSIDMERFLRGQGLESRDWGLQSIPPLPTVKSLSLNVAQSCNLACAYCYADQGRFGGHPRVMAKEKALQIVDRFIGDSNSGSSVVIGFMGGEPLVNKNVIHAVTRHAYERGVRENIDVRFSITTNATLIDERDVSMFAQFPFAVQISLDGNSNTHDDIRKDRKGKGSYELVLRALELFDRIGRPRLLASRISVTTKTGELLPIVDHHLDLGFDEVGLGVVLNSPDKSLALDGADMEQLLRRIVQCGQKALHAFLSNRSYAFSNFMTALDEIHRGGHKPYPCGAGAAYLSANAEGEFYACHRLIDDPNFRMGDLVTGTDDDARRRLLSQRHVDRAEPCRSCWARYLCGGGCYHEVEDVGRPSCHYIRGWLEFCLSAYAELSTKRPEMFQQLNCSTPRPVSSVRSQAIA